MRGRSEPGRLVYSGSMSGAQDHYKAAGFPVPFGVNPLDFYLDLVTPSVPDHKSEELVAYFNTHVAPQLVQSVDAALASPGRSSVSMLRHIREKLLFLGDVPDRSLQSYNVPFTMQLQVVMWRAVTLMRRDRTVLRTTFAVEIVKALVVGIAFFDIGSKAVQDQVSFIYMMLQMSALSAMQTMPRLIDERTVMKMETGDKLYSEWAYIGVSYILNLAISTAANLIFVLLAFSLGGLPFRFFGAFYAWQFLFVQVMTSLFHAVAAVATKSEQAQQLALPFLMLFILFNGALRTCQLGTCHGMAATLTMLPSRLRSSVLAGFFVKLPSVQVWMKWAIYISPFYYSLQQIIVTCFGEPDDPTHVALLAGFEFRKDFGGVAAAVLLGEWAIIRAFQAYALKTMNAVQR